VDLAEALMTGSFDMLDEVEGMDETAATSRCCSRQRSCSSQPSHQTSHGDDYLPSRRPRQRSRGAGSRQSSRGSSVNRSVVVEESHEDSDAAQSKIHPSNSISSISTAATVEHISPVILLDWDDTLCPTTWLKEDCGADWLTPLADELQPGRRRDVILGLLDSHIARVKEFLTASSKIGHVVLVTLAKKTWVDVSTKNWMPALAQTLRDCKVEIVYAQDFVSDDDAKFFDEQDDDVWTQAKARAMQWALRKHDQPWGNCICIGDSMYEIDGIVQAREELVKSGVLLDGQCLTSTLKLMDEPSVEELTAELELAQTWLPFLADRVADFHGEIEAPEDDELQQLHTQITGVVDTNLSWEKLVVSDDNE